MFRKIKRAWDNLTKPRSYGNYVEATYFIQLIRKIAGVSVYTLKSSPAGLVTAHFTYLGFICFVIWYSLYFYSVYGIYYSDQTILRSLYNTKLLHYGDEVERISTTIFVLYTMWKLPFDMRLSCQYVQELINIDKELNNLGEKMNFSRGARLAIVAAIVQIFISFARTLSIWLALANLNTSIPLEKLFQLIHSDELALITTAQYCVYLHELKIRYQIVNKVLESIESPETPAKVSSLLGLSITLTMFLCLILVILYLFYFMEATASGLFHDFQKYANFLTHVFWQIGFAMSVIYLNIYFCEDTVSEAKITAFIIHKIINGEMDPVLRKEALHLSLQVIHQLPSFTARGLCKIDYVLLLEGARTVVTFLVILLQFVTNSHNKESN